MSALLGQSFSCPVIAVQLNGHFHSRVSTLNGISCEYYDRLACIASSQSEYKPSQVPERPELCELEALPDGMRLLCLIS